MRSEKPLRIYGPPGFIGNVKGKLAGYTWNLIKSYPLTIEVYELGKNRVKKAIFASCEGFKVRYEDCGDKILNIDDGFTVEYCFFDHNTTSVGYRIKEPELIKINRDKLDNLGIKAGKWLSILKNSLFNGNRDGDIYIEDLDRALPIKYLEEQIVEYHKSQDITFITDIAPTYDNFKKAIDFAKDSHILLIESMFMKKDFLHAIEKSHLLIPMAKEIFRLSGSRYVKFFHYAPKYDKIKEDFFRELREEIQDNII